MAVDLSTHTGWSIFDDKGQPVKYGLVERTVAWDCFEYPKSFVAVTEEVVGAVLKELDADGAVTDVVIEEINKTSGRFGSRFAQKCLDWLHLDLVKGLLQRPVKIHYINTSDWRKTLHLSVADTRKRAKPLLLELKRLQSEADKSPDKASKKLAQVKVDDFKAVLKKQCIYGKIDKKSISVAYANMKWGYDFKKCDNDITDSLAQGQAFLEGSHLVSNADIF